MITLDELARKHPWMVRPNNYAGRDPYTMFGVECGEGWYDLLDKLMTEIESVCPGGVCISQIKEKFGGLRFYVDGAPREVFDIIDKYEALSEKTCESCGGPGKQTDDGWIVTLCEKCDEKRRKARELRKS